MISSAITKTIRALVVCLWFTEIKTAAAMGPFFFSCNYHGKLDALKQDSGQLMLSVTLDENPKFYEPETSYTVRISSSQNFNGLLITGLLSSSDMKTRIDSSPYGITSIGFSQVDPFSSDFVCGIVYSHVSQSPTSEVTFSWTSPAAGTGCVSFLFTASLGQQIIFKDVLAYEICEQGQETLPSRPNFADFHTNGVILRDDFDSEDDLSLLWSQDSAGINIGDICGEIMHGTAAIFCGNSTIRQLISRSLNMSRASILQFAIGHGNCTPTQNEIEISYCSDSGWKVFDRTMADQYRKVQILHIPDEAKMDSTQIKFSQINTDEGCWALDNILIKENENFPSRLEDNFDPVDTSNWLFMPGANIMRDCMSQGYAMIFKSQADDRTPAYAVTSDLDLSEASIQGSFLTDWILSGGSNVSKGCDHKSENVLVFDGADNRHFCSKSNSLQGKVAVRFTLSIGAGSCSSSISHESDIVLYTINNGKRNVISNFAYNAFKEPKAVSVPIPLYSQTNDAVLCLEQSQHGGQGQNIWAIDTFELIERQNHLNYLMQFSINMRCGPFSPYTRVNVEYSTDFGQSWFLLQQECLPETCKGSHWLYNSSYKSDINTGWFRVTLPLPVASLFRYSRFRWHLHKLGGNDAYWAVDNVYIGDGKKCSDWCSGHGLCRSTGCQCDAGYSGVSCNITSHRLPTFFSSDFNGQTLQSELFEVAFGSKISYACGLIGIGKALVFNQAGQRVLITKPLDASGLKFVQFVILMGRHSTTGTCKAPSRPGDGILIHYTINRGLSWKLLQLVPYDSKREPKVFSLHLPADAMVPGLQVRWWQPNIQDENEGVWAIDDIIITSDLYRSVYSTAVQFYTIYKNSVSFHTGNLTNFCNRTNVLLFHHEKDDHPDTPRYAETQIIEASAGYVLEADVTLSCSSDSDKEREKEENYEVKLQYSRDSGRTWHLLNEWNLPGSSSDHDYHPPSIYHITEFSQWTKVTVLMPEWTWTTSLQMRLIEEGSVDALWAIDNVYMGPSCPMHCHNRGRCRNGVCSCDQDSEGPSCLPRVTLPSGVDDPFDDKKKLIESGWTVIGAEVVASADENAACGSMMSSHYLHFDKIGVRKIVTPELDLIFGGQIQFYIRIGGGKCAVPYERANGVLLQYSIDGGVTWILLDELYYLDYSFPSYIHRGIPKHAMTKQTVFRWWQPKHRGFGQDQWSLDDVIVGEPMHLDDYAILKSPLSLKVNTRRSAAHYPKNPSVHKAFIVLSNEGMPEDFCDAKLDSIVFNKVKGNRFATTDDYKLEEGDTIQFEINIGCSGNFSYDFPVRLEFSHDSGYSWDLVKRACYPAGRPASQMSEISSEDDSATYDCTGTARELTEGSIYYKGDFDVWKRVVISISKRVSAFPVRFRWWQSVPDNYKLLPTQWAIRSIYIGPGCMSFCSGHGFCKVYGTESICVCDNGFEGDHCQTPLSPVSEFWDHFSTPVLEPWWKHPLGLGSGNGCGRLNEGNTMYFSGSGSRIAETVSMDTSQIRLIQFYFRLGDVDNSNTCLIPEHRNEAVMLQYSTDNGITWHLIKELSFDWYSSRSELVTVDIPYKAKSLSTSFRWWQPLREPGEHRSQWALDDVFIGVSDMFSHGFTDAFYGDIISEKRWYRVHGGSLVDYSLCNGQMKEDDSHSLVFSLSEDVSRVAETWDFRLNPGSFLQFDLAMGCEDENPTYDCVQLEYSMDMGLSWQPVIPRCFPGSAVGCDQGLGTSYYAGLHQNWTRHTVPLHDILTNMPSIRFRWIQYYFKANSSSWALDNIYLGNGCPWMCSGHGYCSPSADELEDTCICDPGFETGSLCEPSTILPTSLKDNFEYPWVTEDKYAVVVGREPVMIDDLTSVGIMINGQNLQMGKAGIRLLQTLPLNTTDTKYIQFYMWYQSDGRDPTNIILLQSSSNNGITWKTIHHIPPVRGLADGKHFVHVILPAHSRQSSVSFRWWQVNIRAGESEDVWALENLLIGGSSSNCDMYTMKDSFSRKDGHTDKPDNWLFYHGGRVDEFCNSTGNSLLFEIEAGEHSVSTNDLCVSENYVIQFKIAVGCNAEPSDKHAVHLEFSTDNGITWSLVRPHCQGKQTDSYGCSSEHHPASIFYPGAVQGWRRIVVPLDRQHICSSVRFRWYQGFYADDFEAATAVPWALDDVYIGPACEQMCNGHGICVDEGERCLCDLGYDGATCCDIVKDNLAFFKETFTQDDSHDLWVTTSGAEFLDVSSYCKGTGNIVFEQRKLKAHKPGERILETRDLDTRNSLFIQFYLSLIHPSSAALGRESDIQITQGVNDNFIGDLETVEAETLHLQYSNDGGLRWNTLEIFPFILTNYEMSQYIALHLPESSRSNATRFRWWQPMPKGKSDFQFTVDHVIVGGHSNEIDDDFSSVQHSTWIETSGATIRPNRGSECCPHVTTFNDDPCSVIEVGNNTGHLVECSSRYISTSGTIVFPGSYLSFNLRMNCQDLADSCDSMELEHSTDLGHTWLPLVLPCYPRNPECIQHYQGSTYYSDVYSVPVRASDNRVIVPLPEHSRSPSTRFRWIQHHDSSTSYGSWSVDNVYVGRACPRACSGRGRCHNGQCSCDDGWGGRHCENPDYELPTELKAIFAKGTASNPLFMKQVGARVDNLCGEVGYDSALHFFKSCSRLLLTVPMNTTKADFVQFMFRTGCGASLPYNRNHGVLVDFSTNGGATWHSLAELYFNEFNAKPGFVNVLLPDKAKALGTQFRWWQPENSGLNQNDWAMDNLLIGGKKEEKMLSDDFSVAEEIDPAGLWLDRAEKKMWKFYDNTEPAKFCGRDNVILAGTVSGLDAIVSTKDFLPEEGFILQYTIVVLCEDVQIPHQPVNIQYSTDFGDTWHYLVPQCIPSDQDCFGHDITQPSAHFISPDWRRHTILIPSSLYGQSVRFRFHQESSDVVWALDQIFIGPQCPDACSGHGDCVGISQDEFFKEGDVNYDSKRCLCDIGYAGPNCYLDIEPAHRYLKHDFDTAGKGGSWSIVEAEKLNTNCGMLVDGNSLYFDGVGSRQAVTSDLDLRDARFVQYHAVIGGNNELSTCMPAKTRSDGILLQYSTNGGISWKMLYNLDYASYPQEKHDYIMIPLDAKTNSTRLRWWQPFVTERKTGLFGMGLDRAGWALDNVYIGGQEVNTHVLEDDFEVEYDLNGNPGPLKEELYEFYPNGMVTLGQCPGDSSSHMSWPGDDPMSTGQSLTTRQLIIMPGHMIQFRIKIGCSEKSCSMLYPVKLEYRENPRSDNWELVKPECLPASPPSPRCPHFLYHEPSVYSLDRYHEWTRITIPLDFILSGMTQFRWSQNGGAPELFSWALDDIYIGESCPGYCSGHGRCTKTLQCVCDSGYSGEDCSHPVQRYIVPVFRDNFEGGQINVKRWRHLSGGVIAEGGCGPLWPFGFSKSAYFGECGRREIVTQEIDSTRAWQIQYVLQIGSINPTKECHINKVDEYEPTPMAIILLQFTTNNGVSWHTLREHSASQYGIPRRVSQTLPLLARSTHVIFRWWQPSHGGVAEDQWALDNVNILMSRRNHHLHLLDYHSLITAHQKSGKAFDLQGSKAIGNNPMPENDGVIIPNDIPLSESRSTDAELP